MMISCIGQKGGGTKSAIARTLAVAFTEAGWKTHLCDIDEKQQTSFKWVKRREQSGLSPIDCALYRRVDTAIKMEDKCDLLIVDGRPAAETTSLDVAVGSDLVIIATGTSIDDLEPSLELARELIKKGIQREKIVFSIAKSPSDSEGRKAKATVQAWNFSVLDTVIPFKPGYSSALDSGRALFETPFKTLNEVARKMVEEIHDIINK